MTAVLSAYDARVKDLYRLNKPALVEIIRAQRNIIWTATPIQRWGKDELVRLVLEQEFPHGDPRVDRAALIARVELLCGADAATEPAFALSTSLPCGKCGATRATVLVVVGWTETANVETRVCVDCID